MRRLVVASLALLLLAPVALSAAPDAPVPLRPVHTYSIVARDAATGEMGVAVQSHAFSVGSGVSWAEAGVGAVATQSFIDPSYGPLGLDLMRAGRSAPDALKGLLAADDGRDVRQVAMIDASGRVAAHTGVKCIPAAGNHVGVGYSVQANLMDNDTSGPRWRRRSRRRTATLPNGCSSRSRLLRRRAATSGACSRPRSWSSRVCRAGSRGRTRFSICASRTITQPLVELRRLVNFQRANNLANDGDRYLEKKDDAAALKGLRRRRGAPSRLRRDGLLARGRAGEHGQGGRLAADLREGLSPLPEIPRAAAASGEGRTIARRPEGHRANRRGEIGRTTRPFPRPPARRSTLASSR